MLPADLEIAVVAPYPTAMRIQEGWMSRIASVDRILSRFKRLYIHFAHHHRVGSDDRIIQQSENGWETCLNPDEPQHCSLMGDIVERVRGIYVHTVHLAEFVREWLPSGKFFVDVHGIVPEEEVMLGRPELAPKYEQVEQEVLKHARRVIVVTNAMMRHFYNKYHNIVPNYINLPIFEVYSMEHLPRAQAAQELPVSAVYSGGIQPWQNTDAMLALATRCQETARFTFLSHEAQSIRNLAQDRYPSLQAHFGFCEKHKLPQEYARHDFGLVLRDDTAVNRVSCPTKLSEYLYFGLVPIVRSPDLGDFKDLNYYYITEKEFGEGFFADSLTRSWMREANRNVILELQKRFSSSAHQLVEDFS